MQAAYAVVMGIGVIVAILFSLLVLFTGKGDAMSGGGGIRTTYKGKASFDDQVTRLTFGLGGAFLVLMLIIDAMGHRLK